MQRSLRAAGIQARLKVNEVGDVYEQEAEAVAERVMRMPEPGLQRACACGGECPDCRAQHAEQEVVQTFRNRPTEVGGQDAPPSVREALRSSGRPLAADTEAFFSTRFGHDFRHVRVHTDEAAARSALDLRAAAYTVGRDLVFAPGEYAPGSARGRRLLAHELTHVLQQGGQGALVQRDAKTPATAEDVAKLTVQPKKAGACACLVVVHNDEQKARKTAEAMYRYCNYNLALVEPDIGAREVPIPGLKKIKKDGRDVEVQDTTDPNALFPREVVEKCLDDDAPCQQELKDKAKATKKTDVVKLLQAQYFLGIKECSAGFTLPVVALHNNRINDTQSYLKELNRREAAATAGAPTGGKAKKKKSKPKKLAKDLKADFAAEAGKSKDPRVRKLLDDFTKGVRDELLGTPTKVGMTNIFRWCASNDLSQCHIGDPAHPDHVIWVTSQEDFKKLSGKDVNVAYQSEIPKGKKSESLSDLSTMFLFLRNIQMSKAIDESLGQMEGDAGDIAKVLAELGSLALQGDLTFEDLRSGLETLGVKKESLAGHLWDLLNVGTKFPELRFTNIETGELSASAHPADDYAFIAGALDALGLHCCGDDKEKRTKEESIKADLKKLETPAQK